MKNSYQGIDSTIVKHVRFQASRLKSKSCFINESLEDIEQELFCQVWQYLNQHDEKRSIVFSKMNDKFPLWYYQPKVVSLYIYALKV